MRILIGLLVMVQPLLSTMWLSHVVGLLAALLSASLVLIRLFLFRLLVAIGF
jgi:hypothetical protein